MKRIILLVLTLATFSLPTPAFAGSASVAVASNFLAPMTALAESYEKETGDTIKISAGSTGKLYAQIAAGAPFDLFFAADEKRPAKLAAEGLLVEGSLFPYALGGLVLVSADPKGAIGPESLKGTGKIALANPDMAPYGRAALQAMGMLGLKEFEGRLVKGDNISQAFHFIVTGAAPVGFVALSQIQGKGGGLVGSSWIVPHDLHDPITQACGLVKRGADNATAKAFLAYVKSEKGKGIIAKFGYRIP